MFRSININHPDREQIIPEWSSCFTFWMIPAPHIYQPRRKKLVVCYRHRTLFSISMGDATPDLVLLNPTEKQQHSTTIRSMQSGFRKYASGPAERKMAFFGTRR